MNHCNFSTFIAEDAVATLDKGPWHFVKRLAIPGKRMSTSIVDEALLDGSVEVILAGEWPPGRAKGRPEPFLGSAEEERSIGLVRVVRG